MGENINHWSPFIAKSKLELTVLTLRSTALWFIQKNHSLSVIYYFCQSLYLQKLSEHLRNYGFCGTLVIMSELEPGEGGWIVNNILLTTISNGAFLLVHREILKSKNSQKCGKGSAYLQPVRCILWNLKPYQSSGENLTKGTLEHLTSWYTCAFLRKCTWEMQFTFVVP